MLTLSDDALSSILGQKNWDIMKNNDRQTRVFTCTDIEITWGSNLHPYSHTGGRTMVQLLHREFSSIILPKKVDPDEEMDAFQSCSLGDDYNK